jgi:hypothetical protein
MSISKTLLQTHRTSYVQLQLKNPHRPSVPHEICVGNPGYQVLVYCAELLPEVWVIYKRRGQIFVTSTINHSLYQWHVLISSEICDEN